MHQTGDLAELVCSNSFKSNLLTNASGVLKEEMRRLGSLILPIAEKHRVPAGEALAVDREPFAREVTATLDSASEHHVVREEVTAPADDAPADPRDRPADLRRAGGRDRPADRRRLALLLRCRRAHRHLRQPGPDARSFAPPGAAKAIGNLRGNRAKQTVPRKIATGAAGAKRSAETDGAVGCGGAPAESADYLNCPFEKDEYLAFWKALTEAEIAPLHDFEQGDDAGRRWSSSRCACRSRSWRGAARRRSPSAR